MTEIGHVDWVGGNGLPYRATLHDNGKWQCSEPIFDTMFNHCYDPLDPLSTGGTTASAFGFTALYDAAEAVGGHMHYVAPLYGQVLQEGEVE